jgi:hypothetical protein
LPHSDVTQKFCFRFSENYALFPPSRLDQRGVRVVTNVGRDAVDACHID